MERIIKNILHVYILILLYVYKICQLKIYQITLFLYIHELCESQPLDVHFVALPAQHFLHEIHVRMSSAMQLMLVERSSDGISTIVLE